MLKTNNNRAILVIDTMMIIPVKEFYAKVLNENYLHERFQFQNTKSLYSLGPINTCIVEILTEEFIQSSQKLLDKINIEPKKLYKLIKEKHNFSLFNFIPSRIPYTEHFLKYMYHHFTKNI